MKKAMLNETLINDLRNRLLNLCLHHGLRSMKTGTEVEDMSFSEIELLRTISSGILPLYVKIGGPEARNDIRTLIQLGVDGIIAPMIESPYSLRNFMIAFNEIKDEFPESQVEAGINIETITGYNQMHNIINQPLAQGLKQVTAARTDLSGSMELNPDDQQVLSLCTDIVIACSSKGWVTSVGGAIHPGIIETLIEQIPSDRVNTRHMVISCQDIVNEPRQSLIENLKFEIHLYRALSEDLSNEKRQQHKKRAITLEERLKKHAHFTT
ncbi:MAG: aldolase [Leptonema sp. (in: Bacteria)]|nr:aldolase [Leptonema sp. (in: bacteria)]